MNNNTHTHAHTHIPTQSLTHTLQTGHSTYNISESRDSNALANTNSFNNKGDQVK